MLAKIDGGAEGILGSRALTRKSDRSPEKEKERQTQLYFKMPGNITKEGNG